MAPDLTIGRLARTELDDALALSTQVGWNQTHADWERLLDLCPELCFAGRLDGDLVATSTLAVHGDVGWIGMVLVDESHRRRGYGSAVFERALSAGRERELATIGLDATDAGREVYRQYGFADAVGIARWGGQLRAPVSSDGVAVTDDRDALVEFDRSRVGADRSALLEHLLDSPNATGLVREREGEIAGYAFIRPGRICPQLGPVVADSPVDAAALVSAVAERVDEVIVDALVREATTELLTAAGLEVKRQLRRMIAEASREALTSDATYAAASFEWG